MKIFRSKIFIFALVLVLAASVIMALSYATGRATFITNMLGSVVSPLEKGTAAVTGWFSDIFGYFYRYSALEEENEELRAQVNEYRRLEALYNLVVQENEDLRRLTGLKERHSDFDCELASVISQVTVGFESSFTIGRGSVDGIEPGDCVMTDEGLVGYISDVGLNYAQVVTLINLNSKIGTTISRTQEAVVAEGDFTLAGDGYLKLSYLKNDADIKEGDLVVTSGGGGIYPKGIILGTVREFKMESHGISSYAVVEPAVDLSSLHSVFVVKDFEVVD